MRNLFLNTGLEWSTNHSTTNVLYTVYNIMYWPRIPPPIYITIISLAEGFRQISPYLSEQFQQMSSYLTELVLANGFLFAGTLSANKFLFAGTGLPNKFLFSRTVPAKNLFLYGIKSNSKGLIFGQHRNIIASHRISGRLAGS